jgi:hypothetical protein
MNNTLFFSGLIFIFIGGFLIGLCVERKSYEFGLTQTLIRNGKAHYEVNATTGETTLVLNPEFEIVSGFTNK